jgi:molecular chaperone HtpG
MAKHKFKTEVNQLLHLIIHSLYSHPEIFLRELISNSSDALDKLKYLTLTDEQYKPFSDSLRIDIAFGESAGRIITLSGEGEKKLVMTVSDNGIGMDGKELEENLGTIARSGTRGFLESLTGDAKKDSNLIGQFGVGFYSSFMVADRVEVVSRRAGKQDAYKWISDGRGNFEIVEAEREGNGTTVTLFLNEAGAQFADRWRIEEIVKKYSNHIPFPIYLHYEDIRHEGTGVGRKEITEPKVEQINAASALWQRPKTELKEEDYNEFYRSIAHDTEDPLLCIHTKAEGALQYTTLFYVPKKAPLDLFWADFMPGVKLYIKRVFITDSERELMPHYLRFVRGVIDSEDLPLNISRETLQKNRVLTSIRNASVKKILGELLNLKNDKQKYDAFYREFHRPLKEGVYQDFSNRDSLVELLQFASTKTEGLTGLRGYRERMKPDQKAIYYVTGESERSLRSSPLLEAYVKRDIEVLLMDDEIDEIVIPAIGKYEDVELKSLNRSETAEDLKTKEDRQKERRIAPLAQKIKEILGDEVKDVRASSRLSDSPSCIVTDERDPTMQMQQILKSLGQKDIPEVKPILEINPEHEIVRKLSGISDRELLEDGSRLLFEQALLLEGGQVRDLSEFVRRLNRVLTRSLPDGEDNRKPDGGKARGSGRS